MLSGFTPPSLWSKTHCAIGKTEMKSGRNVHKVASEQFRARSLDFICESLSLDWQVKVYLGI